MRFLYFIIILLFASCIEPPISYTKLPPGEWRAILKLSDPEFGPSVTEDDKLLEFIELPFNLDVSYSDDQMEIFLLNGDERIKVEKVHYGRDPRTAKDTLRLEFTAFDTYIDAFYEENFIEGYWIVSYKDKYKIPFIAEYGKSHRFETDPNEDNVDIDGNWDVTFEFDDKDEAYPATAVFSQNDKEVTGTFMTETGDYRYLQGNVDGKKLKLSVFDAAHAFLFEASLLNDTLYGEFRSGKHYKSNWMAVRSDENNLRDPYAMTQATKEIIEEFQYPDFNGQLVSLSDDQYSGKVKLINIMGTWCPNCRDEIRFLQEVNRQYPDVAIISLAFEKYKEESKAYPMLKKYAEALDIDWPLLYGGQANKKLNSEQIQFVDKIYSYPTLLMLNDKNEIIHIHTGFYGPATPEHQTFVDDFYLKLNRLITGDE